MAQFLTVRIIAFAFIGILAGKCGAQDTAGSDSEKEIAALKAMVEKLQARVAALEKQSGVPAETAAAVPIEPAKPPSVPSQVGVQRAEQTASTPEPKKSTVTDFLRGTSFNLLLDTYYGYNFDDPIGRANRLRAYDVSSNSFSINQADVVVENAPDPANGKRFGIRLDLQYGQATQTLQGNSVNEPRPDIYRAIYQAYGTYIVPVGNGLTVDFGKWTSSLGIEGNYTKDQMNYSRSFWFNYLPFYHAGARVNYKVNDDLALNYWVTNGTQQTEAFNNFKDELFGLAITPAKAVNWTINYYLGQEHPDVQFFNNGPVGVPPNLPTQQGVPFEPIVPAANGKLHIVDTYLTWQASSRHTFAVEGDYVIERLLPSSAPSHTSGGAGYWHYQFMPKSALAVRAEYLSDRGGLFSGATQVLREGTFTLERKLADTFLVRAEWRTDASNHAYFYTPTLGILKKDQSTATLGLVWWVGSKEGPW